MMFRDGLRVDRPFPRRRRTTCGLLMGGSRAIVTRSVSEAIEPGILAYASG
jgi:hypothetical protein